MNASDKALNDSRNLSEQAHERIRRDILNGELFPGEKLQIEGISDRYGIGIAPVREALNRLSSEGLVERKSQRGFFVAGRALIVSNQRLRLGKSSRFCPCGSCGTIHG